MAQRPRPNKDWFREVLAEQNFEPVIDCEYVITRTGINRKPPEHIYTVRCSECGHRLAAGSYIYRLRHYIKHKYEKGEK